MEINITKFFNEADHFDISGSKMEHGENAASITWQNAREARTEYCLLDSVEKDEAFRAHLKGFGAWSEEEIAAFDDCDLNALFLQCVAGDIRDVPGMSPGEWDWTRYEKLASAGNVAGRMFRAEDGEIYYYIGD